MVTLIFLAKKLARAGKPCLVTLLPGGVAWSVTLTSALGLHKAKGWAPGSVAEGKPTWEQGKQGKSGVGFFQGVPDLVRGGRAGGPWPGSSEQVSKVSLEFDLSRGFPTSFAVGVQVVRGLARPGGPRRGGADPRASLRSPWADRRERANGIRGPARRGGPRRGGGSPEPRPRPTEANEPTDSPGWLARQGEVRSQTTKVPRAPQAEGRLALGFREPARSGTTPFGGQPSRGPKLSAQLSA